MTVKNRGKYTEGNREETGKGLEKDEISEENTKKRNKARFRISKDTEEIDNLDDGHTHT